VVYREVFPNTTGANDLLSTDSWAIYADNGALSVNQINSGGAGNSAPTTLPGINSSPNPSTIGGQTAGFAFANDAAGVDYLFVTNEFTVRSMVWDATAISWRMG